MAAGDDILAAMAASNLTWLSSAAVFVTRHGSRAYGTSTPTSDTDYKGIVVEPPRYYLGISQGFEQAEFHKPDAVLFSLKKFMRLAADCNPSVIEVLFTDDRDWVVFPKFGVPRETILALMSHRDDFLSRKARWTFSGYAMSQLKRIRTHHRWLTSPPDHEPTREDFGLPEKTVVPQDQRAAAEAAIKKELDALYTLDLDLDDAGTIKLQDGLAVLKARVEGVVAGARDGMAFVIGRQLGFDTNFLVLLEHERSYKNARIEWEQYQNWKRTRNPERAALEAKFGYDTKHAMHLVRLLRMGTEILAGKGVIVRRPDADELLAIRAGAWTFDQLQAWAETQEATMDVLYQTSKLPHTPDHAALESLCVRLYTNFNHG